MPKKLPEQQPGAAEPEAVEQPADSDAGLSRAERRAKARGKNPQQPAHGVKGFVPKTNQGGSRRNYSNRRAG